VHSRFLSLIALLIAATGAQSQGSTSDAGWQESDVPTPPVVNDKDLIPIDMPANLALRFGVDPKTLTITNDGVVRYVVVASNDRGARNVMYEGVRCATDEVKTYARQDSTGKWTADTQAQWRPLNAGSATAHAMAVSRQGACSGRTVSTDSVTALIKKLRNWKPDPR
jgi:CNP1-like family